MKSLHACQQNDYTHGTALTGGAWLTPLPTLLTVRFCHKLNTTRSQLAHQSPLALCTVTQNGHVLLEMSLVHVHCNTEWTRVVRDVSCAL